MKKVLIGIRGSANLIRADSDPVTDDDARQQLTEIADAAQQGPTTVVKLPWLVVLVSDVVFARTVSLAEMGPSG